MSITRPAQIVEVTGGTSRSLADKLGEIVSVRDYGAKGDGTTDDTAAIQAALNAVQPGKRLWFPAGIYLYSIMLQLKNGKGVELLGEGARLTGAILRWNGAASGTAFRLLNCYKAVVRSLRFDTVVNDPVIMLEIQEDNSLGDYDSTAPSQFCRVESCTIKGGGVGLAVTLGASSGDVMNDSHLFDHNVISTQTVANIQMTGANALGIGLRNNYCLSAPIAVQTLNGPGSNAPSFLWTSGYVNSTVVNFDLAGTSPDGYTIIKVRSESSPRFVRAANGTILSTPINVIGCYYSSASLNADGFAVLLVGGGPFTSIGTMWGQTTPIPKFSFTFAQFAPVVFIGNAFEAAGSDVAALFAGTNYQLTTSGNRYVTGGGTHVTKSDAASPYLALSYVTGSVTSMGSIDLSAASFFKVVATNGLSFGFDNPINPTHGQIFRIQIKATAALNAASPFGGTKFRVPAWTPPASGKNATITFLYDGVSDVYYEIGHSADAPN